METNFINGFKLIAGINDSRFTESALLAEFYSGYGTSWLNCVFRADGTDSSIESLTQNVLSKYDSARPMVWHVGALTKAPEKVKDLLKSHQAVPVGSAPGMVLSTNDARAFKTPDTASLVIRNVATRTEISDWINTFSSSFDLPEHVANHFETFIQRRLGHSSNDFWFVGYVDEVPISSAYYLNDSGVSMIYNVCTLETFRKKGYGRSMMAHVIAHASERFTTPIGLYASEMGYSMYEALGFKRIYEIEEFTYPG